MLGISDKCLRLLSKFSDLPSSIFVVSVINLTKNEGKKYLCIKSLHDVFAGRLRAKDNAE